MSTVQAPITATKTGGERTLDGEDGARALGTADEGGPCGMGVAICARCGVDAGMGVAICPRCGVAAGIGVAICPRCGGWL